VFHVPTLSQTIDAFVASREFDPATISRLAFWADILGSRELADITSEEVDVALAALAERGRLSPRRGQITLNRYISQPQTLYRYARRLRLLPRAHVPSTRGVEKPLIWAQR
jgi:hypothetical protein